MLIKTPGCLTELLSLYLSVRSQFLEKYPDVSAPAPCWWPREVCSSGRTHHRVWPEPGGPGYGYSRPGQSGYLSPLPITKMDRHDMRGWNGAGTTHLTHHSGGAVSKEVVAHGKTVASLHVLHDQFPLSPVTPQ